MTNDHPMNADNFHEYLKNPSMLHQVSYQELKSLVLQYPYSPNLRYLLLLKSLFDHHKDYERNLTLAAVYSVDRKKLYRLLKQYDNLLSAQESFSFAEEFLELKDLSGLEEILEPPVQKEKTGAQKNLGPEVTPKAEKRKKKETQHKPEVEEEDIDFLENLFDESLASLKEPAALEDIPSQEFLGESSAGLSGADEMQNESEEPPELIETLIETSGPEEFLEVDNNITVISEVVEDLPTDIELEEITDPVESGESNSDLAEPEQRREILFEITNETEGSEAVPQPVPKTSFNSWLQQLQPPRMTILSEKFQGIPPLAKNVSSPGQKAGPATKQESDDDAKDLAARSISEDTTIASETLAALLEAQGHYHRAVAMYERLSLQHPEKSSFFAAKIEKLKGK